MKSNHELAFIGGWNPTNIPMKGYNNMNMILNQQNRPGQRPGGNPIFPGVQGGANIEMIRNFIKNQKRCRGFTFELGVGETPLSIDLAGTAKTFLGFSIVFDPGEARTVQARLEINNEIVIQETLIDFFGSEFTDEEYYWFPRPLSGTDSINFIAQTESAQEIFIAVYYV